MPTETLTPTRHRHRPHAAPPSPSRIEHDEMRAAEKTYARRVHRLKLHAIAYGLGAGLVTALWVLIEWNANGRFERFAHEGNPGDWNPTLWALVVGIWGLIVGIMALRVRFERPVRFHTAAWMLGMIVITPLNALIEWQDNGGFKRLSADSQPGSWDPWVLYVGGIWLVAAVALLALKAYAEPSDRR